MRGVGGSAGCVPAALTRCARVSSVPPQSGRLAAGSPASADRAVEVEGWTCSLHLGGRAAGSVLAACWLLAGGDFQSNLKSDLMHA